MPPTHIPILETPVPSPLCSHVSSPCATFGISSGGGQVYIVANDIHSSATGALIRRPGTWDFDYRHNAGPDGGDCAAGPYAYTEGAVVRVFFGGGVARITMDQPNGFRAPDGCSSLHQRAAMAAQMRTGTLCGLHGKNKCAVFAAEVTATTLEIVARKLHGAATAHFDHFDWNPTKKVLTVEYHHTGSPDGGSITTDAIQRPHPGAFKVVIKYNGGDCHITMDQPNGFQSCDDC